MSGRHSGLRSSPTELHDKLSPPRFYSKRTCSHTHNLLYRLEGRFILYEFTGREFGRLVALSTHDRSDNLCTLKTLALKTPVKHSNMQTISHAETYS